MPSCEFWPKAFRQKDLAAKSSLCELELRSSLPNIHFLNAAITLTILSTGKRKSAFEQKRSLNFSPNEKLLLGFRLM